MTICSSMCICCRTVHIRSQQIPHVHASQGLLESRPSKQLLYGQNLIFINLQQMATSMHGRYVSQCVSHSMYRVEIALLITFTTNTQCISHSHPQPAMEHIHIGSCSQFHFTAVDPRNILPVASPYIEFLINQDRRMVTSFQ